MEADRLEAEEAEARRREAEEQVARDEQQTAAAEARAALPRDKKPLLPDFNDDKMVPDHIPLRASQYAINKIADVEYVGLHYWTDKGLKEVSSTNKAGTGDDTFGITKVNDTIALRSVSSALASRNFVRDEDLSFREMSMARILMVNQMVESRAWPDRYIRAMIEFFVLIESHPLRMRPKGEEILVRYQAKVRWMWHDRIKPGAPSLTLL